MKKRHADDEDNQSNKKQNIGDIAHAELLNTNAAGQEQEAPEAAALPAPENAKFYDNKGKSLLASGKYEQALKCFDKAINLDPGDAWHHSSKGNALMRWGKYDEAMKCYDEAIRLDPHWDLRHSSKGDALVQWGKHQEAVECYDEAIRLAPQFAWNYRSKGDALVQLGKHKEAMEYYDKAIRLDPENAEHYDNKGYALYKLGQYEQALEYYNEAIKLDPIQGEYHYNRGSTLSNLDKKAEAIESYNNAADLCGLSNGGVSIACYNEIITLDPNNAYAYCNKGNILYTLGEFNKTLKCYNKVIAISQKARLEGSYIDAWLNKYNIHVSNGNNKKAVSECDLKLKSLLPKLYGYIQEYIQPNVVAGIVLSYATGFHNLKEANSVLDKAIATGFDSMETAITVLGEESGAEG